MPTDPPAASPAGAPTYSERLWPRPSGWFLVVGFAGLVLIALLPVGTAVALVGAAVVAVAGVVAAVRTAPLVEVRGGELRAGAAHIPLGLLGPAQALDAAATRHALGPGLDARTFVCLRGWVRTAVLVPVHDPADPTPAWLVSSRHPAELAAAITPVASGTSATQPPPVPGTH